MSFIVSSQKLYKCKIYFRLSKLILAQEPKISAKTLPKNYALNLQKASAYSLKLLIKVSQTLFASILPRKFFLRYNSTSNELDQVKITL